MEYIEDYATGVKMPELGAEANRQEIEKILIESKGYKKEDIGVDTSFELEIEDKPYRTKLDLTININGKTLVAIKAVAGSISSWEREIVAGARILIEDYQIPFSVVSDAKDLNLYDTITGKKIGSGFDSFPLRSDLEKYLVENELKKYPKERLERQKMVFRTYDTLNVNR